MGRAAVGGGGVGLICGALCLLLVVVDLVLAMGRVVTCRLSARMWLVGLGSWVLGVRGPLLAVVLRRVVGSVVVGAGVGSGVGLGRFG